MICSRRGMAAISGWIGMDSGIYLHSSTTLFSGADSAAGPPESSYLALWCYGCVVSLLVLYDKVQADR